MPWENTRDGDGLVDLAADHGSLEWDKARRESVGVWRAAGMILLGVFWVHALPWGIWLGLGIVLAATHFSDVTMWMLLALEVMAIGVGLGMTVNAIKRIGGLYFGVWLMFGVVACAAEWPWFDSIL